MPSQLLPTVRMSRVGGSLASAGAGREQRRADENQQQLPHVRAALLRAASARTCSCSTARLSCASVRLTFPRTIGPASCSDSHDQIPPPATPNCRRSSTRVQSAALAQPPAAALVDAGDRRPGQVALRPELDGLDQPADLGRADPHQHPVARAEPGARPAARTPSASRRRRSRAPATGRCTCSQTSDGGARTSTCSAILIRSPGSAARRPAPRASPASAARCARRPRRRRARARTPRAGGSAAAPRP